MSYDNPHRIGAESSPLDGATHKQQKISFNSTFRMKAI